MGVFHFDIEAHSPVPAEKMYKALLLDGDNLVSKVLPRLVKHVEIIKGDGGVGTIKQVTFGEDVEFKTAKQRIDEIDERNLTYSYSLIEGDVPEGVFESIRNDFKVIPSSGGCTIKHKITYNTTGEAKLTDDQIKDAKEKSATILRAVESYLLANPDAY